jgi:photosystem II stability/assembly factor-like uncharacterized protein
MRAMLWGVCAALLACAIVSVAVPADAAALLSTGDGGWVWQNPLPQGNGMSCVCMVDADHGWAVGGAGTILATTDGGVTWTPQDTGTDADFGSVFFLDTEHGWVSGVEQYLRWGQPADRYVVLATSDGGATWTAQDLGPDGPDLSVSLTFVDQQHGWAVGNQQVETEDGYEWLPVIRATSDGGATWNAQDLGAADGLTLSSAAFVDQDHGWVVGNKPGADDWPQSVLLTTTDGGATWSSSDLAASSGPVYRDITFADLDHGWAVGFDQRNTGTCSILASTDGGATWHEQYSDGPGSFGLGSVAFADPSHGWAVGSQWGAFDPEGILLATTDGGATWEAQTTGPGKQIALHDVAVADETHCLVAGTAGTVLSTSDGGATWREFGSAGAGRRAHLLSVSFSDPDHGWAVGAHARGADAGVIFATSDGGATWSAQDPGTGVGSLDCVDFPDRQHGWAVGRGGAILTTADGGDSWRQQPVGRVRDQAFTSVAFADATHGWVVGGNGYITATSDGGAHWRRQASGTPGDLESVVCVDADHAWALIAGYDAQHRYLGSLLRTKDGGVTWVRLRRRATGNLSAVSFVTRRSGWAVADTGEILATTDAGTHWVTQRRASGASMTLASVFFLDRTRGWVWGYDGALLSTVDGGQHWNRQDLGVGRVGQLGGLVFIDADHGWAVGADGMILATANGGHPTTPDAAAPTTTARTTHPPGYRLGGWCNAPVTVDLKAVDDAAGWGVARTEYKIDDASSWTTGISARVSALPDHTSDGAHTIAYFSTDLAGNVEAEQTCQVLIDTRRPRPLAPVAARVARGSIATLGYRIADAAPNGGTARVIIVIRDAAGRQVERLSRSSVPVNTAQTATFICHLAPGTYRFFVAAVDTAGNRQLTRAVNKLLVR